MVWLDDPWLPGGCGEGCWDAYLDFVPRHIEHGRLISDSKLDRRLTEAGAASPAGRTGLHGEPLRQRIVDGLNIGFLLDGLERRELAVAILDESREAGVTRQKLLFWDPEVGSFEALLLLPAGEALRPGIVGLHGHRDSDEVFARDYLARRLAESGFAVLMPRLRVHDCSRRENGIARVLLRHGFTLMGLRVYETLLMLKYLSAHPSVAAERIGILGHSGGSSTANLAVRISEGFAAHVVDYEVDYLNECGPRGIHCETVPALAPIAADINAFGSLPVAHLRVPYRFEDETVRVRIVDFLRRHLGDNGGGSGGKP